MPKILIIYHSQSGNTEKMAKSMEKGAKSIPRTKVILKRASFANLQDLLECDGLAIGSPEYFGYMAGAIKDFLDRVYEEAMGKVTKKPYVVFISAGNDGSGALNSIKRICTGLKLKEIYYPVVARGKVSDKILKECENLGKTLAAWLDLMDLS